MQLNSMAVNITRIVVQKMLKKKFHFTRSYNFYNLYEAGHKIDIFLLSQQQSSERCYESLQASNVNNLISMSSFHL